MFEPRNKRKCTGHIGKGLASVDDFVDKRRGACRFVRPYVIADFSKVGLRVIDPATLDPKAVADYAAKAAHGQGLVDYLMQEPWQERRWQATPSR